MPQNVVPAPSPKPIKILLIDDHAVVRTGLRMFIESHPGMTVVGEAANQADALTVAEASHPDVILLDLDLGGASGLDFLPALLSIAPSSRVLILTGVRDPALHSRAVSLGAMGVVLKEQAGKVLVLAIEKVHTGEIWIERAMMASVLHDLARAHAGKTDTGEGAKIAALSKREREVVGLISQGLSNKQIADRLCISATTVRHHLTAIFSKLDVTSRLELVVYAYRHDLVKPPG